jgi:cation diffusion facilitator CzcD-associated flavoprotein CzcO
MPKVPAELDPMDLSEAPIDGAHEARELPERAGVVIVGSGFSGLCMAIKLKEAGRHDFVILEKAHDVGGTWRENTYPGAGCDIQSHLYSFSFEMNPKWSRMFARQPEILDYLRHCVRKYMLEEHLYFGVEVSGGAYDDESDEWRVQLADGREIRSDVAVLGLGPLHRPVLPDVPGIESFEGPSWHSAEWNHDYDLTGKRVAVIGTGASSIQFVPKIAEMAARIHLFQRTPAWIMPKRDRHISGLTKALYRAVPGLQRAHRNLIYWILETRVIGFAVNPKLLKAAQGIADAHRKRQVPDPELRRRLTPDYTMGCKRVLISSDFYPTLSKEHVELVDGAVAEVRPRSVVTADGAVREVDAIIYGTGFHVTDSFDNLDLVGPGGRKLREEWADGLSAYYGMTVHGFPNVFLLVGPNSGLGHNSIIFMIEAQVNYIMECLRLLDRQGAKRMQPTRRAQDRFNAGIQRDLVKQVWSVGGCKSWYLDARGRNTTIWPGFTWRYWQRTRKPDPDAFVFEG